MDAFVRASIGEHLAAAQQAGDDPRIPGAVAQLSALKAIAVCLDQVVNRSIDDVHRYGHVDRGTAATNADDFVAVRRHLRVLELGLETGKRMLAAVEAQPGIKPEPPAKAQSTRRGSPDR